MLSSALRTQVGCCCGDAGSAEHERRALISAIIHLVRQEGVPADIQQAALTLVGWLARRQDWEHPCSRGVVEARKQFMPVTVGRR